MGMAEAHRGFNGSDLEVSPDSARISQVLPGARGATRTRGPLLRKQMLYPLSYAGRVCLFYYRTRSWSTDCIW